VEVFMKKIVIFVVCLCVAISAFSETKHIVVLLDRQVIQLFENDSKISEFNCITGADNSTPVGKFYIVYRGNKNTVSKLYNNAPMPYALFFSDGCAIHGTCCTDIRSYSRYFGYDGVGTHGCIGVSVDHAKIIFEWAPNGTPIIIKKKS
jgi:L,D-transpeptidase catalytic domain.